MIKRSLHVGTSTLVMLLMAVCSLVVAFTLWVMTAPRDIPFIASALESKLNAHLHPNFTIQIPKTVLTWDSNRHTIVLQAREVSITNLHHITTMSVPIVTLGFNPFSLLSGHITPTVFRVDNPTFRFTFAPTEPLPAPANLELALPQALTASLFDFLQNKGNFPVSSITINNATAYILGQHESTWHLTKATLSLRSSMLRLEGIAEVGGETMRGEMELTLQKKRKTNGTIHAKAEFTSLPLHQWIALIRTITGQKLDLISPNTRLISSIKMQTTLLPSGQFGPIDAEIQEMRGIYHDTQHFPHPLPLKNLRGALRVEEQGRALSIKQLQLDIQNGPSIQLQGLLRKQKDDTTEINLTTSLAHVTFDSLYHYWPLTLSPKVREWMEQGMRTGTVTQASGTFALQYQGSFPVSLPAESLQATVDFQDIGVRYWPDFPEVTGAKGTAIFNGERIDIAVENAKIGTNSSIHQATVVIPYHTSKETPLTIKGSVNGKAGDLLGFVPKSFLKDIPFSQATLSGAALTDVFIGLPTLSQLTYDQVDFQVHSSLHNVTLLSLLPGWQIGKSELTADFNGKKVILKGNTQLNNTQAQLEWVFDIGNHQQKPPSDITLTLPVTPALLASVNANLPMFTAGSAPTTVRIHLAANDNHADIESDLTHAAIDWPMAAIKKPISVPAALHFTVLFEEDAFVVPSFEAKGDGLDINGRLTFAKAPAQLTHLLLTRAITDTHRIEQLQYEHKEHRHTLSLEGSQLDFQRFPLDQLSSKTDASEEQWDASFRVKKMLMHGGEIWSDVHGNLHCTTRSCSEAFLSTDLGDKEKLHLSLAMHDKEQVLLIESSDTGKALRALNLSQGIKGGVLHLEAKGKDALSGSMKLEKFTAVKTSLLAKIITLSSIPAMIQLVNEQGIYFDGLLAPFSLHKGIVTINEARAAGSAMGLTIDGKMDIKKKHFQLRGAVIPTVYGINRLIGNIPLIGNVLMGGKNEGIIAVSYRLEGPFATAEPSVNPLSILTPGFLRKVFNVRDIFKSTPQKKQEQPSKEK